MRLQTRVRGRALTASGPRIAPVVDVDDALTATAAVSALEAAVELANDPDPDLDALVALAREPLDLDAIINEAEPAYGPVPEPAAAVPSSPLEADGLTAAALAAIQDAHERTLAAVGAYAATRRHQEGDLSLTASVAESLSRLVDRPAPPINVEVHPASIEVHTPEVRPAEVVVHVAAAEAPVVNVAAAEIVLPEQPAPVVNVAVAAPVPAPAPPAAARELRVVRDATGKMTGVEEVTREEAV